MRPCVLVLVVVAGVRGRRLFPYTTLFRSERLRGRGIDSAVRRAAVVADGDGDGGRAVRVGGRRVGQRRGRAGRSDRRAGAEETGRGHVCTPVTEVLRAPSCR